MPPSISCTRWITSWALLLGVWAGCARVVPPSGGPKDSLAPMLVRSVPPQGSVGFRGKVVTLEFSEDIVLNNINQQLIISPLQDNPYTYRIRRRRLELTFEKPFPDSATVFLNFRQAVQDLNEKTAAKHLQLAFATGQELDTLTIGGQVRDLLSAKPVLNTTVGLWPDSDTTDIRRQRPQYLTQTDSAGRYRLDNLRTGRYQIAAFNDQNGNTLWNNKREALGFAPGPLTLSHDTSIDFLLSSVDEAIPRLERTTAAPKAQVEVQFAEGLARLDAYLGPDSLPRQPAGQNGAQYRIYLPTVWQDTIRLRLVATDSSGNVRDTVARVAPYKIPRNARPDTGKTVFRLQPGSESGGSYFLPAEASLLIPEPMSFSAPIPTLTLRADSQPLTRPVKTRYNRYRNQLHFTLPAVAAKTYTLYIPASLATTTGASIRPDTLPFPIATEEQVGLIRGRVAATAAHTILELLTDQGQAVHTLFDANTFEFLGLPPGNYVLRLTLDANGNRRQDPARYSTRTMPERVLPPSLPIKVKANWEVEAGDVFADE